MTDNLQSRPNPERLARRLTELEDQLRLSVGPAGGSLRAHPALGRLQSAARLLGALEDGDPGQGWSRLAKAATRFCATARTHPERLPETWEAGLERTARALERVLTRLDDGLDPERAAGEVPAEAWPAGGDDPPGAELQQWRARLADWEVEAAPAASDDVLRSRAALWREIRERGDRLFRAPLAGVARPGSGERLAAAGVQLGLLLASPFQREQLAERLRGLDVRHLSDPAEVPLWLAQEPEQAVLLADNLEPGRHLERALEQLESMPGRRPGRCLLVAGALAAARPQGRRTLPAGVDGVWEPPYGLADLTALITGS